MHRLAAVQLWKSLVGMLHTKNQTDKEQSTQPETQTPEGNVASQRLRGRKRNFLCLTAIKLWIQFTLCAVLFSEPRPKNISKVFFPGINLFFLLASV